MSRRARQRQEAWAAKHLAYADDEPHDEMDSYEPEPDSPYNHTGAEQEKGAQDAKD